MILTEVTFKQGLEAKQLSSVALGESGRRGSMDNGYKKDFFFCGGEICIGFSLWCRLLFLHHMGSLVVVQRFSCPVVGS